MNTDTIHSKIKETAQLVRQINIGARMMEVMEDDNIPFFLCDFDMVEFKFIWVSSNCYKIFGYTAEEMEGKRYSEFVKPEDVAASDEIVTKNLHKKVTVADFENTYISKDGKYYIPMRWFSDQSKGNKSFCVGFPGERIKINE